jgi:hypothetical protein
MLKLGWQQKLDTRASRIFEAEIFRGSRHPRLKAARLAMRAPGILAAKDQKDQARVG